MDKTYNKYFFTDLYAENGGGSYDNAAQWKPFFENIAKNIVELFDPKTVLDAGCAFGYLVKAFRDLGIEAYGFDISEYASSPFSVPVNRPSYISPMAIYMEEKPFKVVGAGIRTVVIPACSIVKISFEARGVEVITRSGIRSVIAFISGFAAVPTCLAARTSSG